MLYYQYTLGAPVWIAKAYMYLRITFVLLKDLYMRLIYPPVESDALAG